MKPDHYIEFCDTLKASQLLTRPFQLRKDGRLPNRMVVQLLPYLVAYVRYTPAICVPPARGLAVAHLQEAGGYLSWTRASVMKGAFGAHGTDKGRVN